MKKNIIILFLLVILTSCTITINSDEVSMKGNSLSENNNLDTTNEIDKNPNSSIINIDQSVETNIVNADSKRLKDINDLIKKINIETSKGTSLNSMIIVNKNYKVTINGNLETVYKGIINFDALREKNINFQDNINGKIIDYPFAYSQGGTGTGAFKFMQISTFNDEKKQAIVVGNYYKIKPTDSDSLFIDDNGNYITDGGKILPY